MVVAAAGAVALLVAGLGAGAHYWGRTRISAPQAGERLVAPPPPQRPELPSATPAVPLAPPDASSATPVAPAVVPADVAPTAGSPDREAPDVVPLNTPMRLAIHPRGRVWVRLVVDGVPQFARELGVGDREERDVRDNAFVEVGNAAAFDFSVNNRPGRVLGGEGRVVRARIDRQSVQALLAR